MKRYNKKYSKYEVLIKRKHPCATTAYADTNLNVLCAKESSS